MCTVLLTIICFTNLEPKFWSFLPTFKTLLAIAADVSCIISQKRFLVFPTTTAFIRVATPHDEGVTSENVWNHEDIELKNETQEFAVNIFFHKENSIKCVKVLYLYQMMNDPHFHIAEVCQAENYIKKKQKNDG